jgi:hypothetical protein
VNWTGILQPLTLRKIRAKVLRDWYVVQMDEAGIVDFVENKLK